MTSDEISAALSEAVKTLLALPDPDGRWIGELRAAWPAVHDPVDKWIAALAPEVVAVGRTAGQDVTAARGYDPPVERRERPSPGAIDRMIPVLLWLRWLSPRQRRLVWRVAAGWPWWKLAGKMRMGEEEAREWHRKAIERVRARLSLALKGSG